jgi:hypothetical protein
VRGQPRHCPRGIRGVEGGRLPARVPAGSRWTQHARARPPGRNRGDREAKGERAAQLIEDLKKADMAREAERLLDATGWLPEPLRLRVADATESPDAGDPEALPAFLADDADGAPRAVAAE